MAEINVYTLDIQLLINGDKAPQKFDLSKLKYADAPDINMSNIEKNQPCITGDYPISDVFKTRLFKMSINERLPYFFNETTYRTILDTTKKPPTEQNKIQIWIDANFEYNIKITLKLLFPTFGTSINTSIINNFTTSYNSLFRRDIENIDNFNELTYNNKSTILKINKAGVITKTMWVNDFINHPKYKKFIMDTVNYNQWKRSTQPGGAQLILDRYVRALKKFMIDLIKDCYANDIQQRKIDKNNSQLYQFQKPTEELKNNIILLQLDLTIQQYITESEVTGVSRNTEFISSLNIFKNLLIQLATKIDKFKEKINTVISDAILNETMTDEIVKTYGRTKYGNITINDEWWFLDVINIDLKNMTIIKILIEISKITSTNSTRFTYYDKFMSSVIKKIADLKTLNLNYLAYVKYVTAPGITILSSSSPISEDEKEILNVANAVKQYDDYVKLVSDTIMMRRSTNTILQGLLLDNFYSYSILSENSAEKNAVISFVGTAAIEGILTKWNNKFILNNNSVTDSFNKLNEINISGKNGRVIRINNLLNIGASMMLYNSIVEIYVAVQTMDVPITFTSNDLKRFNDTEGYNESIAESRIIAFLNRSRAFQKLSSFFTFNFNPKNPYLIENYFQQIVHTKPNRKLTRQSKRNSTTRRNSTNNAMNFNPVAI